MAFEYGKRITIDSSKVDTALANYPVQVKLTDENFDFSLCKADGSDIRFFDLEDNALKFERVSHTPTQAVYNVNVPSISNTKNTEFVLRCGDSTLYNTSIEAWQDMTGKALTYNGNVKLEYDSTLGRRRAVFDGSGDYFEVPTSSDFDFGTSDFGIECIITPHTSVNSYIFSSADNNNFNLYINASNKVVFWVRTSDLAITSTTSIIANQTYNIVCSRHGNTFSLYVNGVLEGTITNADAHKITGVLRIGRSYTTTSVYYKGIISGLRITKGRARYTANFTLPTSFEIDGPDVVFCTNFDTIYIADEMPLPHEWVMVSNLAILYSYKVNWLNDYLNKYDTRPLNSIQLNVSSVDGYSEDFILTKEMNWSGEFEIQDKEGLSFNFESLPNYISASSIANSHIELNNSLLTTTYTTSGVTWKDNNDEYAARPSNFDIDLNLNGKFFERKLTSTGVEVFTNLPLMDRLGRQFTYSSEVPNKIDGYVVENGNVLRKTIELSLGMFNGVLLNNWRTIHRIYKGEFRVVQGKMWLLNGPPLTAIPEIQYGWNDSASWDDLGVWTEFIGRFSTFYEIGLNKDEEGTLFSNYKLLNNDVLYK